MLGERERRSGATATLETPWNHRHRYGVSLLLSPGRKHHKLRKLTHSVPHRCVELWRRHISSFALCGRRKDRRGRGSDGIGPPRVATIRAGEKIGYLLGPRSDLGHAGSWSEYYMQIRQFPRCLLSALNRGQWEPLTRVSAGVNHIRTGNRAASVRRNTVLLARPRVILRTRGIWKRTREIFRDFLWNALGTCQVNE